MEQGFVFVHAAARLLANPAAEAGAQVRRRFDGLLAAMQRHRRRVIDLGAALDHFRKVARSYRPGLFHAPDVTASASLVLPGGVDLPVAADDVLIATSSAAGVWRVRHVQAADGSVRASVVTPMTSTLGTAAAPWPSLFATTVTAGAGGSFASLLINGNADSDAGATLAGRKSRGTLAAPAVVQANDRILQLTGQAYQGTAYVTAAQVIGRVIAPTPSATNLQSRLEVLLAPANSVAQSAALSLDFTAGLGLLGSTVVDGARHLRTRSYTRATLPTPSSASLGLAHVVNPETSKGELVINTAGTAWRYMDGTTTSSMRDAAGSSTSAIPSKPGPPSLGGPKIMPRANQTETVSDLC